MTLQLSEFKAENLVMNNPKMKTAKQDTVTYYIGKLQYNFGTPDQKNIRAIDIEFPEVTINGMSDKYGLSAGIIIDKDMPERETIISICADIENFISEAVFARKGGYGDKKLRETETAADVKRDIEKLLYQRTDEDGDAASPNLVIYTKLYGSGAYGATKLTGLDGKLISPYALKQAMFKCIPVVRISDFYCGSKKKIRVYIKSAVITKIVDNNMRTEAVIKTFSDEQKSDFEKQMADLMKMQGDQKATVQLDDSKSSETETTPVVNGSDSRYQYGNKLINVGGPPQGMVTGFLNQQAGFQGQQAGFPNQQAGFPNQQAGFQGQAGGQVPVFPTQANGQIDLEKFQQMGITSGSNLGESREMYQRKPEYPPQSQVSNFMAQ